MKIKRYFAADAREAMRLVREDQGPNAVILANRSVNGGVEIIAAEDYDESSFDEAAPLFDAAAPAAARSEPQPAPQPEPQPLLRPVAAGVGPAEAASGDGPTLAAMQREMRTLRGLLENQLSHLAWSNAAPQGSVQLALLGRLRALGLGVQLAQSIVAKVPETTDSERAWRAALGVLAHLIRTTDDDILSRGGVVSVVGPTGVGKTTMVAKLAARYALRHGKRHVALVSTDSFRVGACEQLQTYGRLLGVPVYWAADGAELTAVLADLADKHLVLIDTAGMSQRDLGLAERLAALAPGQREVQTYLALAANVQLVTLQEIAQNYRRVPLAGCLITKVDEAASLGEVISTVVQHDLPVAYVGDGQRVPEDLQPARANNLIARAAALARPSRSAPIAESRADAHRKVAHAH
ncbi:MAG: flagellar biosynthesis protein FlhF [Porticoccaceae bacterium]